VVSAKLLADTEALLQMQGSGGGAGERAAVRQMMYGPRALPLPYLMTQLTQFSVPLQYPDHGSVMELRRMRHGWVRARAAGGLGRGRGRAGRPVCMGC
jgi:hypothetical protein